MMTILKNNALKSLIIKQNKANPFLSKQENHILQSKPVSVNRTDSFKNREQSSSKNDLESYPVKEKSSRPPPADYPPIEAESPVNMPQEETKGQYYPNNETSPEPKEQPNSNEESKENNTLIIDHLTDEEDSDEPQSVVTEETELIDPKVDDDKQRSARGERKSSSNSSCISDESDEKDENNQNLDKVFDELCNDILEDCSYESHSDEFLHNLNNAKDLNLKKDLFEKYDISLQNSLIDNIDVLNFIYFDNSKIIPEKILKEVVSQGGFTFLLCNKASKKQILATSLSKQKINTCLKKTTKFEQLKVDSNELRNMMEEENLIVNDCIISQLCSA